MCKFPLDPGTATGWWAVRPARVKPRSFPSNPGCSRLFNYLGVVVVQALVGLTRADQRAHDFLSRFNAYTQVSICFGVVRVHSTYVLRSCTVCAVMAKLGLYTASSLRLVGQFLLLPRPTLSAPVRIRWGGEIRLVMPGGKAHATVGSHRRQKWKTRWVGGTKIKKDRGACPDLG